MHGLRRPSYDCSLKVPNDSLKRYSLRTIHEPQQYSLRERTLKYNAAGTGTEPKQSWRHGSIASYLTRFSISDGSPEYREAMLKQAGKFDWAIYMGISLAFVVLILSLTMLYVIANQKVAYVIR